MPNTASIIALAVLALSGLYLLALGAVALSAPHMAKPFLSGFASTAGKHFLELGLRLIVGAAFIQAAPLLAWPLPAQLFGWVLLATTVVLCFVPWRQHREIAERTVAQVTPYMRAIGVAAVSAGAAVLASVYAAGAA